MKQPASRSPLTSHPLKLPTDAARLQRAITLLGSRAKSELAPKARQELEQLLGTYPSAQQAAVWKQTLRQIQKKQHSSGEAAPRSTLLGKCVSTRSDGTPCRAPALRGERHCFYHHPANAERVDQIRRMGHEASRKKPAGPSEQELAAEATQPATKIRKPSQPQQPGRAQEKATGAPSTLPVQQELPIPEILRPPFAAASDEPASSAPRAKTAEGTEPSPGPASAAKPEPRAALPAAVDAVLEVLAGRADLPAAVPEPHPPSPGDSGPMRESLTPADVSVASFGEILKTLSVAVNQTLCLENSLERNKLIGSLVEIALKVIVVSSDSKSKQESIQRPDPSVKKYDTRPPIQDSSAIEHKNLQHPSAIEVSIDLVDIVIPSHINTKLNPQKTQVVRDFVAKHKAIPEPIIVYQVGDRYHLDDGLRRYRVAQEFGLKTIPVIVKGKK